MVISRINYLAKDHTKGFVLLGGWGEGHRVISMSCLGKGGLQ